MRKFKRLNRKGFTLIELLAVIVILAVVMTIAATSVLSAMNNSRKSSLEDTSIALQRAFQTKYSEAMVTNTLSDIYGDVLKSSGTVTNGFDFTTATTGTPVFYSIPSGLSDELNLAGTAYLLDGTTKPKKYSVASSAVTVEGTFVAFDGDKVVVCAVANRTGNMYVANEANTSTATIFNTTVTFDGPDDYATFMWTCSDGQTSWKNAGSQTS